MKATFRELFLVTAAVGLLCLSSLVGAAPAAAAALMKTQAPCTTATNYCLSFAAGDPIPVIRSISFTAPDAGSAQVTFHGSLYCANTGSIADKVVDLATQIVNDRKATPDPNGPGGLRHAIVLKDTTQNAQNTSDTFNLASTRVLALSPGSHKFYFKIASLRMDAGTTCFVYNAAFSIIFIS